MSLYISITLLALAFVSFLYAVYKHEVRMQAIETKVFAGDIDARLQALEAKTFKSAKKRATRKRSVKK